MPSPSDSKEQFIAELIAAYEQAVCDGSAPSLDQYIRKYPDIAEELRRQIQIGRAMRLHLKVEDTSSESVAGGIQRLLSAIDAPQNPSGNPETQNQPRSAGDLIAKIRRRKGMRVSALAQAVGGSEDDVRRIEADQSSSAEGSILKKILSFLGIDEDLYASLLKRTTYLEAPAYFRRKEDRNREKPRG